MEEQPRQEAEQIPGDAVPVDQDCCWN